MDDEEDVEGENHEVSAIELAEKMDESKFESPLFQSENSEEVPHFSSVIKEIKDGKENSHLVKIRPPLFLLSGFLSNISRRLSGMENLKILDNERWREREVEHIKNIHPDILISETEYENAFLIEKIEGELAYEILGSENISDKRKIEVIEQLTTALKNIHDRSLYHGEPTTQNCILGDDGDVYWIDFEIEYHEDLTDQEMKARDLEQLTLSILGAFEEEGDLGINDERIIDLILDNYDDRIVTATFVNNHHLPLIGPHRIYQLSFVSLKRFYQVQINLMKYLQES